MAPTAPLKPQALRYEVHSHFYGRPMITAGPMAGCCGFPTHRWIRRHARPLGLKRAKALADSLPYHAVVTVWQVAGPVYDNGKRPELPTGWVAEPWEAK